MLLKFPIKTGMKKQNNAVRKVSKIPTEKRKICSIYQHHRRFKPFAGFNKGVN